MNGMGVSDKASVTATLKEMSRVAVAYHDAIAAGLRELTGLDVRLLTTNEGQALMRSERIVGELQAVGITRLLTSKDTCDKANPFASDTRLLADLENGQISYIQQVDASWPVHKPYELGVVLAVNILLS